jgi:hypothetical protein
VQKATASASVVCIDATKPDARTQSPLAECELLADIEGRGKQIKAMVLIDSGAEVNIMKPKIADQLVQLGAVVQPTTMGYYGVDGATRVARGIIAVYLRIARKGVQLPTVPIGPLSWV